jgi:hypothetical protein
VPFNNNRRKRTPKKLCARARKGRKAKGRARMAKIKGRARMARIKELLLDFH